MAKKLTKAQRAILREMAYGYRIVVTYDAAGQEAEIVEFDGPFVATNVTAKDVENLLKVKYIAAALGVRRADRTWAWKGFEITDAGRDALEGGVR
jgi:hypothetical protein